MKLLSGVPEKRLRIRRVDGVENGMAKMNSAMVKQLQISDKIEVVIAGKRKCILTVLVDDNVPEREVWANPAQMVSLGIADNSIATIRRPIR
ncbi:MAG: hypothetical protein QXP13_04315 [Candidatus Methanomethylicia archaeon]